MEWRMEGPMQRGKITEPPPLIKLVEQYLAENSSLSYINIEDMVDCFRQRFHRFQRMQRNPFARMVREAYGEYCRRANAPRQMPSPARSNGSRTSHLDDEVVEIDDDDDKVVPRKSNYLSSSLNMMYKTSASQPVISLAGSPSETPIGGHEQQEETSPGGSGSKQRSQIIIDVQETSAVVPDSSQKTFETSADSAMDKCEDSDDDLEILDEIQGNRSVIQESDSQNIPAGVTVTIGPGGSRQEDGFVPSSKPGSQDISKSPADTDRMPSTKTKSVTQSTRVSPIYFPDSSRKPETHDSDVIQRGVKRKNAVPSTENVPAVKQDNSKKAKKEIPVVNQSGYRLQDFAGSEKVVENVCRMIMHLKHPEVYQIIGVTAPRGFLLHGPPGVGKTLLAHAIAGELQLPMLKVTGTEFISGISGESESNIRDLFNQALSVAPCIIFIDEIDSITPKRATAQREMERRIVAQLLSCVDDLLNHEKGSQVLLIGATNRVEAIDSALRRAGRFDKEICLGIPDETSRGKILKVICKDLRLAPGLDLQVIAKLTPGYVGADLQMLVREAAVQAVNKTLTRRHDIEQDTLQQPEPLVPDVPLKTSPTKEIELAVTATVVNLMNKMDNAPKRGEFATTADEQLPLESEAESTAHDKSQKDEGLAGESVVTPIVESGEHEKTCGENMEVDDSPVSVPKIVSVSSGDEAKSDVTGVNADKDSGLCPASRADGYLRWIEETAPLSSYELDKLYIFMDDFVEALKHVQPSSKREGFATVPDTTWEDIGALADIREELEVSILGPVKYSQAFSTLGLTTPAGVLLCGPPGCGKTLLAKAVANEAGINFISVKGPELLNMYVGESERAVRQCFIRAKNSSPCVIFFDEIDALCPRRSDAPDSGSGSRIVNQLLTEMDGVESREGVFIMAATNRPDILDPAILRPGRLDKILFVDLPSANDRLEILKTITKNGTKPPLSADVDLKVVAENELCEFYTGADLAALVREASVALFKELIMNKSQENADLSRLSVSMRHFEQALRKTKPSVTEKDRDKYHEMKRRYSVTGSR